MASIAATRVAASVRSGLRRRSPPAAAIAVGGFAAVRCLVLAAVVISAHRRGRDAHRLFLRWDAQWYARIAEHGYGFVRTTPDGRRLSDLAFFPMYPWTERFVARGTGLAAVDAGLVVSAVAGLLAVGGMFAVARDVLGERAAVLATVLWALVPVGVVESMAYSESLFTALAAWSLVALRRECWLSAAVLACAAGLTRPEGIAVVAAVLVVVVDSIRQGTRCRRPRAARLLSDRRFAALAIAPAGTLGYLGWVAIDTNNLAGYFQVTRGWGNDLDGGIRFARWIGAQFAGSSPVDGTLLVIALAVLILLVVQCARQGQPLALLVYTIMVVMLALTTSGYFGSKPRYLLPAFPLLFPLAQWLELRTVATRISVLLTCCVVASTSGALWLLGPGPP